jgi:porin
VELNVVLGYRGWNVPFPAFNDTLTQDAGGIRSALAEYGIGFIGYGSPRFFANLLDTPTRVPNTFPKCPSDASVSGALCAGNRAYFGQSPDAVYGVSMVLTYDLQRLGIPDGLLAVGGSFSGGDYQAYSPNINRVNLLSWYQTAFDRRMEVEFGYLQGLQQFVGQTVGGNFANPFGPSGSIPALLGLSAGTAATPMFRSTFHMTGDLKNGFYNEFAVSRSVPVRGPYGVYQNEVTLNPTGFDFFSSQPGTGALFTDELGYRQQSKPGQLGEWFRVGTMYNTSTFRDLSRVSVDPNASIDGSGGSIYVLGDQQIYQPDSTKPGRGIYVGATFMYASPNVASITQYKEARAYWVGPFDSRPSDMISLVWAHNDISKYVAATPFNPLTGVGVAAFTNTYTASYAARLAAGTYLTVGLSYSDHPSVRYFQGEGSALNFVSSLTLVF